MTKSCFECRFCMVVDEGYSNYTVTGQEVHCLKKAHPCGGYDKFYGEAENACFAEKCASYEFGAPVEIDCDRDKTWAHSGSSKTIAEAYAPNDEIKTLMEYFDL